MTPHKPKTITKALPLNFLLGCSQAMLENFELARLAEVADLRKEVQILFDRIYDVMSQAALASWFRAQDRQALKHAIDNEETPLEFAKRTIRERGQSEEELLPLPSLPPGMAHLAAAIRYQQRNIAEGKCQNCPEPLDPNSVRYCTKHLAMARHKAARRAGVRGEPGSVDFLYGEVKESTHGRQPGTLQSLAMAREQRTREILAEMGVSPEHAATALQATKEALLKVMPSSKAEALTANELFAQISLPADNRTGDRALGELFSAGEVQRFGKGGIGHPYRYFVATPEGRKLKPANQTKEKNRVLLQALRGEEPCPDE